MTDTEIQWLNTLEVMDLLGLKQWQVSRIAKREGWQTHPERLYHQAIRYKLEDVVAYQHVLKRTALVNRWLVKLGKHRHWLVRDSRYDAVCPTCGGYAVYKPPISIFANPALRSNKEIWCEKCEIVKAPEGA